LEFAQVYALKDYSWKTQQKNAKLDAIPGMLKIQLAFVLLDVLVTLRHLLTLLIGYVYTLVRA